MSREQQKRGKQEKGCDGAEKVIVAVKASTKEIPKTALVWSLTHVVQPGDCITLLVVVPSQNSGRKWGFPRFAGDCAGGIKKYPPGTILEQKSDITDSCSQMILQLHDVYDPNKINVRIKIVSGSPCGSVAAEAKKGQASWVVLDKHLKPEEKKCMEELQCNIVVMKRAQPKVLRLNLIGPKKKEVEEACSSPSVQGDMLEKQTKNKIDSLVDSIKGPNVTPTSSPELGTPFTTTTEAGTSSASSSDPGTSPFFISMNGESKKEETIKESQELCDTNSDTESESLSTSSASFRYQPWITELLLHQQSSQRNEERSEPYHGMPQATTTKALLEKFSRLDRGAEIEMSAAYRKDSDFSGNLREAIALSGNAPLGPPPLCSICQHKAPVFGKPPRWFSYAELELATGGFSQANFLAEGGYGSVHRGVLPEGQVIAVKQHKLASSQGDVEFCSEVEVLSCAQHRNVVMLIGFCIEDKRRLLVYEYICNGSLDSHLYGRQRDPLEWSARQKIAVGAARGLRYLHEECRVGCIIHRDMRPNNILITHDFEPLVGDFGLARWQPDGDMGVDTRVIGTFGYLAPEYAQSGQITEKADVYSFGVVLVELVTGRKAVDLTRPKGQQCLAEWARPLLEEYAIDELIDPRLGLNLHSILRSEMENSGSGEVEEEEALLVKAAKSTDELYLLRDTFFPQNPDDRTSKLQQHSDLILTLLDSVPPEERKSPTQRAVFEHLRGKVLDVFPEYKKEAEDHLSKAVKLNPSLADAWLCLGNCIWKKGDLSAAKNCLNLALNKGPNKKILCQLSMLKRSMSQSADNQAELVDESIQHAKEAIALDVKDGNSWYNLGNAYLTSFFVTGGWDHTRLSHSLKAYQNAEKDEGIKSNPDFYFNSAIANKYLENYDRALSGFEAAASKDPGLNAAEEVQKIVNLLDNVDNLLRVHVRAKRIASLAASLAAVNLKSPYRTVTIDLLSEGLNRALAVDGKVLFLIRSEGVAPLYYLLCDSNQTCFVLSIYGVRQDVIKGGDQLTLLDPCFRDVDVSWKEKHYQFKSIRLDFYEQVLVNGKALTPQQAIRTSIYAQHKP